MNFILKKLLRFLLPKTIQKHSILNGQLKGAVIHTSWYNYPAAILGYTEKPLLEWFSRHVLPGQTWLDIGAHYGYTAIALCRLVGETGQVLAFEPMLSTCGHLSQTRESNEFHQLQIFPIALGNVDGMEQRYLPSVRGMVDSSLAPIQAGWQEPFWLASLDWLSNQVEIKKPIHGIKIDVQGMEIETLQGMSATLKQYRPKLVVEVHAGVNRETLIDLIRQSGYSAKAVPIEPVEGEREAQYLDNRSYYFYPETS